MVVKSNTNKCDCDNKKSHVQKYGYDKKIAQTFDSACVLVGIGMYTRKHQSNACLAHG